MAVGDDDVRAINLAEHACAEADAVERAGKFTDLHHIAHFYGPFKEEDHPGNEIVDDVLQAKADADANRAADQRKLGEIDAKRRDGEEKCSDEDEVMQGGRDGVTHAAAQIDAGINILFQE